MQETLVQFLGWEDPLEKGPAMPISWIILQFFVIHKVKGFGIVNKAKVDVFLELPCFFDDPTDVGNLISSSSAFLKPA